MAEKTKYLHENKEIGDVLAQGFAKICQQKPQFPINYLARFLKNYTINNQQKTNLIDKLQHNKLIEEKIKQLSLENQAKQLAKSQEKQKKQDEQNNFLKSISEQKQPQSLLNGFCQWVASSLQLSAVYVGELEYQTKKIDLIKEDGEEAHLQTQKDKIVKFKYASTKQHGIIVGQKLGLQSVVGKLLTQNPQTQGQQGSPQDEEGGQPKNQESQNLSLYLDSVVGNQQLKFFTFPKLGAYFATTLSLKTYLSEKLIDQNIQKVQNYRKLHSEYEKEMQEKQAKFREQYDQKTHSGADQKELQQMQHEFQNQKNNSTPKPSQQPFSFTERKFVICADTLGKDIPITLQQRTQILRFIRYLKTSWQSQQQSQLTQDIQKQLSLLTPSHEQGHDGQVPNYQQQLTTLFQEEEKDIIAHEEVQKVKDNQKLFQLELNTLRFEKTKQYLTQEKYLKFWNHILSLNVLKYQQILKQYLILLGFTKEKFCFPNTNQLDWLKTKNLLKSSQTSINQKLHSLTPRGSKPQKVPAYAKCPRINKNLQNLEVLSIASYNVYLALILRLLQLYTKTRQQDRQARVTKISTQRQLRQQKLKQAEDKTNQKNQKLNTLKAELQEKGELQTFDQEAWNNQYDEQNPAVQVPEEVSDDVDNDLEEAEEKEPTD